MTRDRDFNSLLSVLPPEHHAGLGGDANSERSDDGRVQPKILAVLSAA